MCGLGRGVWDRRRKEGGLRHLVLLCTRPLAPALSVSSVDPWTCHLDFPTNHIKVSSPGIHQAKWILDPDRPDGEKALCNPALLWSDMIYPSPLHPPSRLPSVPFIADGQSLWRGVELTVIKKKEELHVNRLRFSLFDLERHVSIKIFHISHNLTY